MIPGFGSLSNLLDLRQFGDYAKIAIRGASHRTELAGIELAEAKAEAAVSLVMLWGTSALLLLFGFAATLLVAAAVWDGPHRLSVLGGLAGLYLLGALLLGFLLKRRIAAWKPFAATKDQFLKDTECLERIINNPDS